MVSIRDGIVVYAAPKQLLGEILTVRYQVSGGSSAPNPAVKLGVPLVPALPKLSQDFCSGNRNLLSLRVLYDLCDTCVTV